MVDLESLGVEHQAVRSGAAITGVSHDGRTRRGEVNPYLVLATGDRFRLHEE